DRERGTLEPLTFQQDGFPQRYQVVYPEPGKWRPKLRNSLNSFAQQWFKNIRQQDYHKHKAIIVRNGEDVDLIFDQNGRPVDTAPGHSEPEQTETGTAIPPVPEAVPDTTGAGAPKAQEAADTIPTEPDLAPNTEEYLNLKARHPDKLVGVQVGSYMLFYGRDAER